MTYAIEQKKTEGSPGAIVVTWQGVEVAAFTHCDSAEYFVERDVANRRQCVQMDAPSALKVVDDKSIRDDICPRCGGALEPGQALFDITMTRPGVAWEKEGTPVLQDCQKCHSCGYSETYPTK